MGAKGAGYPNPDLLCPFYFFSYKTSKPETMALLSFSLITVLPAAGTVLD
jgi:hypothetical protein